MGTGTLNRNCTAASLVMVDACDVREELVYAQGALHEVTDPAAGHRVARRVTASVVSPIESGVGERAVVAREPRHLTRRRPAVQAWLDDQRLELLPRQHPFDLALPGMPGVPAEQRPAGGYPRRQLQRSGDTEASDVPAA